MQGISIRGQWATSKKAIKEAIANGDCVHLEPTSVFGNEYGGWVQNAPNGTYTFVGPDPYTSRKFYGTLVVRDGKVTVK